MALANRPDVIPFRRYGFLLGILRIIPMRRYPAAGCLRNETSKKKFFFKPWFARLLHSAIRPVAPNVFAHLHTFLLYLYVYWSLLGRQLNLSSRGIIKKNGFKTFIQLNSYPRASPTWLFNLACTILKCFAILDLLGIVLVSYCYWPGLGKFGSCKKLS